MDDSERSYGYSRDIYHGVGGIGGHYDETNRLERSYEYGAEGDPAEQSPEEAAMHVIEGASLQTGGGEDTADPGVYDYSRSSSYGQVESFTWADNDGPHRGRGPRGYRRADDRIREELCERLEDHGAVDASNIEVKVESGEVTLEGTVSDRRSKRLAEALAEEVRGVVDVHNRLRLG